MARILDNGLSGIDSSLIGNSSVGVGEDVNENDLLYLCGLTGKSYRVDISDYAAIGNLTYGTAQSSEATGRVVPHTSFSGSTPNADSRLATLHDAYNDIFSLITHNGGITGAVINKLSAAGSALKSITLTDTGLTRNHHILELSNGNIAALYAIDTNLYLAAYDRFLREIKPPTIIATCYSPFFSAISLIAGGLAVVYQDNSTPLLSKMVTFDNSGNAVLSATTIWTRTGTTGNQHHKVKQLSDGNIVFAISSVNTISSIGLHYGIQTISGAQIFATTLLDVVSAAWFPQISVSQGYFSIARANGTDQKAWVFDNSGILQGGEFSQATTAGIESHKVKLLFGDGDFYLIWHRSSDSKCVLTKLPLIGANFVTVEITLVSTSQYNYYIDAFFEEGYIVAISTTNNASSPKVWVIDAYNMMLVHKIGTTIGLNPAGTAVGSKLASLIPSGDRTFIATYDYTSGGTDNAVNICVGKWAMTAIIGVAMEDAVRDSSVAIQTAPGVYKINPIDGSTYKVFDMRDGSIAGNKGVMVASGLVTIYGIGSGV
ncbi:hypothetical protein [Nitrosomonas ureae]|uniref:Uncharacterized protein n=1 Tax=Nitrosomonas ureae TaxID=44577 RepID=A0A2T5ISL7_9PROT|nr:hypothetical protein [Nitrosomonas ureae]PTQ86829.1 hypothetical protein C8R28_100824 [Nitrosomonas ureae]